MSTLPKEMKAFSRWLGAGPTAVVAEVLNAAARLRAPFEAAGFRLVDKTFDSSGAPAHSLNLEREGLPGDTDYVVITFDKRRDLRFQVIFGSKETRPPHKWVKSGALVRKAGSELDKHKWWGATWWSFDKRKALASATDEVVSLVPQALHFLATGEAGKNVHSVDLATSRRGPA